MLFRAIEYEVILSDGDCSYVGPDAECVVIVCLGYFQSLVDQFEGIFVVGRLSSD